MTKPMQKVVEKERLIAEETSVWRIQNVGYDRGSSEPSESKGSTP